jgi:CheY-like chemotaxis protein
MNSFIKTDGIMEKINDSVTVLVVEDEAALRKMIQIMLNHMGYTVIAAKDGADALDTFRRHRDIISCVLCDLYMPGMDGLETMTALREISPAVPFVMTSGHDSKPEISDRGPFPQVFLSKPYELKDLGEAIRRALAGLKLKSRNSLSHAQCLSIV